MYNEGKVTLNYCTVSNNPASISGGGVYNDGGKATLNNCTVSGNSAANGGGLYNIAGYYGGTATLTTCTVSGNSATVSGGGLFNATDSQYGAATANLTTCTVSGNSAVNGGGIANQGTLNVSLPAISSRTRRRPRVVASPRPLARRRSPVPSSTATRPVRLGPPWAAGSSVQTVFCR